VNYFETDAHIFTHADYDPDRPMSHVSGTTLRWELLDLNRLRPHHSGKTVVVATACCQATCFGSAALAQRPMFFCIMWPASRPISTYG
jgi:hypothetical protein